MQNLILISIVKHHTKTNGIYDRQFELFMVYPYNPGRKIVSFICYSTSGGVPTGLGATVKEIAVNMFNDVIDDGVRYIYCNNDISPSTTLGQLIKPNVIGD